MNISLSTTQIGYYNLLYKQETPLKQIAIATPQAAATALTSLITSTYFSFTQPQRAEKENQHCQLALEFLDALPALLYRRSFSILKTIPITGKEMNGVFSHKIIEKCDLIVDRLLKSKRTLFNTIGVRLIFIPFGVVALITRLAETVLIAPVALIATALTGGRIKKLHLILLQNFHPIALIQDLLRNIEGCIAPSRSKQNYFLGKRAEQIEKNSLYQEIFEEACFTTLEQERIESSFKKKEGGGTLYSSPYIRKTVLKKLSRYNNDRIKELILILKSLFGDDLAGTIPSISSNKTNLIQWQGKRINKNRYLFLLETLFPLQEEQLTIAKKAVEGIVKKYKSFSINLNNVLTLLVSTGIGHLLISEKADAVTNKMNATIAAHISRYKNRSDENQSSKQEESFQQLIENQLVKEFKEEIRSQLIKNLEKINLENADTFSEQLYQRASSKI